MEILLYGSNVALHITNETCNTDVPCPPNRWGFVEGALLCPCNRNTCDDWN